MKAKKLLGIIFTTIGAIILIAVIAVVAIVIKQEKDSAADCETLEALVEVIEQAKETPLGSSTLDAFVMPGNPPLRQMRIVVNSSGCDILPLELIKEDAEIAEAFKEAMDSVNPNWRTDYTSKRDVTYEIRLYGGTGKIYFERVPSGFSK